MTRETLRKKMRGTVVSTAMDKTVVVAVETLKTHKKYNKKYLSTKKYKAHDEENACSEGDVVDIVACAPMSKDKKFTVIK